MYNFYFHFLFTVCDKGSIRLVGSNNSNEGTIEICVDREWFLISDSAWDDTDAAVACRQLNYQGYSSEICHCF